MIWFVAVFWMHSHHVTHWIYPAVASVAFWLGISGLVWAGFMLMELGGPPHE